MSARIGYVIFKSIWWKIRPPNLLDAERNSFSLMRAAPSCNWCDYDVILRPFFSITMRRSEICYVLFDCVAGQFRSRDRQFCCRTRSRAPVERGRVSTELSQRTFVLQRQPYESRSTRLRTGRQCSGRQRSHKTRIYGSLF